MITLREARMRGADRLAAVGIESARLDARVLLAHVMHLTTGESIFAREPSPEEMARYDALLERRAAREPVAYITGEREFWSLPFAVGPGVLIPRPETETLIEEAMRSFPDHAAPLDVLDLGTGSGCLLIAFLREYPNARGVGVDLSEAALGWARRNGDGNGVASRTTWSLGNWDGAAGRSFDVLFCNPPYLADYEMAGVAPEIACFEPQGALLAGEDGLDAYRALAPIILGYLKPEGRAFLELGRGQGELVSKIMEQAGLQTLGLTPDLAGIARCLTLGGISGRNSWGSEKTVGNQTPSR